MLDIGAKAVRNRGLLWRRTSHDWRVFIWRQRIPTALIPNNSACCTALQLTDMQKWSHSISPQYFNVESIFFSCVITSSKWMAWVMALFKPRCSFGCHLAFSQALQLASHSETSPVRLWITPGHLEHDVILRCEDTIMTRWEATFWLCSKWPGLNTQSQCCEYLKNGVRTKNQGRLLATPLKQIPVQLSIVACYPSQTISNAHQS